jgi:hypothetical protein
LLHLLDDANLPKVLCDLRFSRGGVETGNKDGAINTQLVHLMKEGRKEGGREGGLVLLMSKIKNQTNKYINKGIKE